MKALIYLRFRLELNTNAKWTKYKRQVFLLELNTNAKWTKYKRQVEKYNVELCIYLC